MSQVTPLASGTLNGHDQVIIELVESADADAPARDRDPLAKQSDCDGTSRLRSGRC
jgi:hypothetical protein